MRYRVSNALERKEQNGQTKQPGLLHPNKDATYQRFMCMTLAENWRKLRAPSTGSYSSVLQETQEEKQKRFVCLLSRARE